MGLTKLHPIIKEVFPEAICHVNRQVDAVMCDVVSQTYTSNKVGSEGHKKKAFEVGCVNPYDSDEEKRVYDPITGTETYPKPWEIAKHVMVDSLNLVTWKARFMLFFTDRREIELIWKARTRKRRAISAAKRLEPYPLNAIKAFVDEGVIDAKGKLDTEFPLRGDRVMINFKHRQLFMDYLLHWSLRYAWPSGSNYIFRVQGHTEHAILANPDEPFTLDDPIEYAEADYEIPWQMKTLYEKYGCRSFVVFSVDSDLILILLARFFDLLIAPLGVEEGNRGMEIFLFRGKLPKDKNGNDQPAYINMRAVAQRLAAASCSSGLFTSIAILSHDSDYFDKKWATSYVNMKVGYYYMKQIARYFVQLGKPFDWKSFASIKRLIHCMLHCHEHFTRMSRSLRPKCGWKPKRVKKSFADDGKGKGDVDDQEDEGGEADGVDEGDDDNGPALFQAQPASYRPPKPNSAPLTPEQEEEQARLAKEAEERAQQTNLLLREINAFHIPQFASLQSTVDSLMGEGKKKKKTVPNWLKNGLDLENTFKTLISVLDKAEEEKKLAAQKERERKRKQNVQSLRLDAFENFHSSVAETKEELTVSKFKASHIVFEDNGTSDLQFDPVDVVDLEAVDDTGMPSAPSQPVASQQEPSGEGETKLTDSLQVYLNTVGTRYIKDQLAQDGTEVELMFIRSSSQDKPVPVLTTSPTKPTADKIFDASQRRLFQNSDCTPWEMFCVFSNMIHNLQIWPTNPFSEGKRLSLTNDSSNEWFYAKDHFQT